MKTATVRDLRNNFAKLETWLAAGEKVEIRLFEFRQSVRLPVRLRRKDPNLGFGEKEGAAMLRDLQSDLSSGVLEVIPADWAGVFALAEMLSAKHTESGGHRFADILHVATALQLGASEFLTFDANQRALAQAEGLVVLSEGDF